MPLAQSPNAAWKAYTAGGGTLSFTNWLHREKEKMFYSNGDDTNNLFLKNKQLNDSTQTAINDMLSQGGLKTTESGKTVFGIKKSIIIGGGIVLAAVIIYLVAKNVKKPLRVTTG